MFYQNTCVLISIFSQSINESSATTFVISLRAKQRFWSAIRHLSSWDGPLKTLWGGGGGGRLGNFRPAGIFRYQISCMIFLGHSMNFFHLMFPWENFLFLYFARPPHKFSNGPSLRVCAWENQAGDDFKTTISTTSWSQTSLTKVESSVKFI